MRRGKRGQAAMEFLMTYGWAILAAIIAIGVLAYFGVFSPGKYVAGTAVVSAPFYVNAWNVQADYGPGASGVVLELKNNGDATYTVQSLDVSGCGTNTTALAVNASALVTANVGCSGALVEGDTFKGDITITYRKAGSAVDLTSTGTIAEKVTA